MGNSLGNKVLFPAPGSSYEASLPGLIWDRENDDSQPRPFLLIKSHCVQSPHYIVYFHGNACDLGHIRSELRELSKHTNANIIAVEYPGYGIYSDPSGPTAEGIDAVSDHVLKYLLGKGVSSENLVFFGRSIGSGSACRLASICMQRGDRIGGLILQSPYTSVHGIVDEYSRIGSWLLSNHWRNDEVISHPSSSFPLLIIHGKMDDIIPSEHGKALFEMSPSDKKIFVNPDSATHNDWNHYEDVVYPIRDFLQKYL
jgi:abhydrolase domain-containing protein 17